MEFMHLANFAFFLNFNDGMSKDEVESELLRTMLQSKNETQYDRDMGGSFNLIEQNESSDLSVVYFIFIANMIESIYKLNSEHNHEPYIIIGSDSFDVEKTETGIDIYIEWQLLQDIMIKGQLIYGG